MNSSTPTPEDATSPNGFLDDFFRMLEEAGAVLITDEIVEDDTDDR